MSNRHLHLPRPIPQTDAWWNDEEHHTPLQSLRITLPQWGAIPITEGPQPPYHTTKPCLRCDWMRQHYNLAHWVRLRGDRRV